VKRRNRFVATLLTIVVLALFGAGDGRMAAATREGSELLGTPSPPLTGLAWVGGHSFSLEELRGKVVLLRWWTEGCAYCANTAPALAALHQRYGPKGLVVIGVYHPKPPGPRSEAAVTAAAARLGLRFPIAIDARWEVLRRWWLDGGERGFTSVSFLLDRRGRIRFVHPGGEFYPGDGPPGRDYEAIRRTIERLLAEVE
jgi:peroxiredoxin